MVIRQDPRGRGAITPGVQLMLIDIHNAVPFHTVSVLPGKRIGAGITISQATYQSISPHVKDHTCFK